MDALTGIIAYVRILIEYRQLFLYMRSCPLMFRMTDIIPVTQVLKLTGTVGGTAHAVLFMIGQYKLEHILSVLS